MIHIDHFGNATTNIPAELLAGAGVSVFVGTREIGPVKSTYGDVSRGRPVALIGSSGLLEIAVRENSAARVLKLRPGSPVAWRKQVSLGQHIGDAEGADHQ